MVNQTLENAKIGWRLGSVGFQFIKTHRITLLFSFFSGCLYVLTLLFFLLPFLSISLAEHSFSHHWLLAFLFLFLTTVFSSLMKVALSIYTNAFFEGMPLGFFGSIAHAFLRLFAIAQWAFIDSVIGTLVKALRTKNKNEGILFSILSQLVGTALQLGWNVFTFFVIPLLAFENLSTIETIKESAEILKKTWGPTAGATFNIGFIGLGWLLTWYLFFFGPFTVYCKYFLEKPVATEKTVFLIICGSMAFIVPLILMSMLVTTVTTIVKTALFNYTQQKPTGPFAADLLKISFSS